MKRKYLKSKRWKVFATAAATAVVLAGSGIPAVPAIAAEENVTAENNNSTAAVSQNNETDSTKNAGTNGPEDDATPPVTSNPVSKSATTGQESDPAKNPEQTSNADSNGGETDTFTGLREDSKNGNKLTLYENGIKQEDYTGIYHNTNQPDKQAEYYYINNGVVDGSNAGIIRGSGEDKNWYDVKSDGTAVLANGVYETEVDGTSAKWYFKDGQVEKTTGIVSSEDEKYYVKDGKVDETVNGIVSSGDARYYVKSGQVAKVTDVLQINGKGSWYNIVDGQLTAGPTVARNGNGWWYINNNGIVDFGYNGLATNRYGTWYLTGGKVRFNVTDVKYINGHWYNLVGSKVTTGPTVARNSNGWWYINKDGIVDFGFNGLASNRYGTWYLTGGKVRFNTTDVKFINGKWYNLVGSKVTAGPTVAHNGNGWWYINKDGIVDFDFNGLASNRYGTWYLTDGKVRFNTTDVKYLDGHWYNLVGSKVTAGPTVAHNSNGWWYINRNGIVDFSFNGLASNHYGTWYLTGGKVGFNVTDVKYINGKWYNLVNSKVTTGPTVGKNVHGLWYINRNGVVDFGYNGTVKSNGRIWYSTNGKCSDKDPMDAKAQGYFSSTRNLILVNCSTHVVKVYQGSKNNWKPIQSYICCTGKSTTPTVKGVFHVGYKGTYFVTGGGQLRCWYYTQIYGSYLFHSVLYYGDNAPRRIADGTLGKSVSHGCVRLALNNAKWIYDNIPKGTTVVVY